MPHIRKQHEGANDIYFNQQHQQLIPTTLRPKQHIGRLGGFVKDNGRQFNCQLKSIRGYPNNIRGNGHRKTRTNARPLAKAKQNKEIDNNHKQTRSRFGSVP